MRKPAEEHDGRANIIVRLRRLPTRGWTSVVARIVTYNPSRSALPMTSVARSSSEDQPPDLRTASFRSPKVGAAGLLAAGAPLSLLLANTDWFFTREVYLDPWNYVGLFHQYLDPDYLP